MSKIVNLLLIAFALTLVGCQKAKEIEVEPAEVNLVSPKNGSQIRSLKDRMLAIELKGGANINGDMQLNLNGVTIYGNGADASVHSAVFVSSSFAQTKLSSNEIKPIVVSGMNTFNVQIPSQGINQSYTFYLDNIKPELVVSEITKSLTNPNDTTIKGRIISATNIEKLAIINGMEEEAGLSGDAPNQIFSVDIPDQYLSASAAPVNSPSVSYVITDSSGSTHKGEWVLADANIARAAETFISYSAMDFLEKPINQLLARIIELLAKGQGTGLGPGENNDPFGRTTPDSWQVGDEVDYSSCATTGGNNCYYGANNSGTGPIFSIVPINSFPGTPCNSVVFDSGVDVCALYITDVSIKTPKLDFSWNKDQDRPQLHADLKIPYGSSASIQIVGLKYDQNYCSVKYYGRNEYELVQGACPTSGVDDAQITSEKFGIDKGMYRYQGALKTNIRIKETHISTSFDVSKGNSGEIINITRKPDFVASVNDVAEIFFGEKAEKPEFYGTSCNICNISVGGANIRLEDVEALFNFTNLKVGKVFESLPVDLPSDYEICKDETVNGCWKVLTASYLQTNLGGALDGLTNRFAVIFNRLSSPLNFDSNLDDATQFDMTAERLTSHNYLEAWLPSFLEPYAIGARLGFDGAIKYQSRNALVPDSPKDMRKNTATFVPFVKNGGFNDWMFYDKIFPDKQPVQFAFALSNNAINQYLASNFIEGNFDNYPVILESSDFEEVVNNFSPGEIIQGNQYVLNFSLEQAPSIKLQPFQKQVSYGGCVEFQGMGNCGKGDEYEKILQKEIKAQVKLSVPNVVATLCDRTMLSNDNDCDVNNPDKLLSVNASLSVGALVSGAGLKPKKDFAEVLVNEVLDSTGLVVNNQATLSGSVSLIIAKALSSKSGEIDNLLLLKSSKLGSDARYELRDAETLLGDADQWKVDPNKSATLFDSIPFSSPKELFNLSSLPFAMGVSLKTLKIDAGGDYVTFAGNFNYVPLDGCKTGSQPASINDSNAEKFIKAYCYE